MACFLQVKCWIIRDAATQSNMLVVSAKKSNLLEGILETGTEQSFESEWMDVRDRLRSFCRRLGGNMFRGDEIFQRTSIRMWRAYKDFERRSTFLVWGYRIASNEADRIFAQEIAESRRRTEMPEDDRIAAPEKTEALIDPGPQLRVALNRAVKSRWLTEQDRAVLQARLDWPDEGWIEIGCRLRLAANTCAATHRRAIAKFRLYLFIQAPKLLGGPAEIEAAYKRSIKAADNSLNNEEQTVFLEVVIRHQRTYRQRGWKESLNSACFKVSRHLSGPFTGRP